MAKPTKTGTTLASIAQLLRETKKGQEAKYIRPDTASFVMVEPKVFIARPTDGCG